MPGYLDRFFACPGFRQFQGQVGQIRFCLRKDVDPSSYGGCSVEEVRGHEPHESDTLLFAKRHMADPEPFKVICLVPASVAASLRASFQQPVGDNPRRPIGTPVSKNVSAFAPRCHGQGSISSDALAYLVGWVEGSLPRLSRPVSYPLLDLRRHEIRDAPFCAPVPWQAPRRFRVITLLRNDDEDSDDGADNLPIELVDD